MRLADQLGTFDRNFTSNQRQLTIRDANEKNCITKERERERFFASMGRPKKQCQTPFMSMTWFVHFVSIVSLIASIPSE